MNKNNLQELSEPQEHCYHGGSFWRLLGDEFESLSTASDVINADVLDAWFDPAPAVIAALEQNLALLVRTSPPTHAEGMVRAISRARQIPASSILTAAGSSSLIFLAFQRWFTASSRVFLLDPMYGEYRHILEKVIGCKVDSAVSIATEGFRVNIASIEARLRECRYDAVVLVNPNSPTGTLLSGSELTGLICQFPETVFWIDETYMEYAGVENSLESFAASSSNTFVSKSMSKVYALSGLRAAYMVGPGSGIAELGVHLPPWAVSLPAQLAAVTALNSEPYYREQYQRTAVLREKLRAYLAASCGIQSFPSVTNCLLCELPPGAPSAMEVVRQCEKEKLFLRAGEGIHPSLGKRVIRLAVKSEAMNRRMVEILRHVVGAAGASTR